MRKIVLSFTALGAVLALSVPLTSAQAQATRTWVSGVGDDVNPCSRTAPCKTFAGAISKTATNGEINCLDPGGFGTLTITKSITVDCHEIFASVLNSGINGMTINYDAFQAGDVRRSVKLRNINFNGADTGTNGIRIIGGAQSANSEVAIEDCLIDGNFGGTARGITDERSNGGKLFVSNTTIRNVGGSGIVVLPTSGSVKIDVTLSNVRVFNAVNGGVAIGAGVKAMIVNSVFAGNGTGLDSEGAAAEMSADNVTVSGNGTGLTTAAGGIIRLSNSNVSFNGVGINGTVNSFTNNRFVTNGAGGAITPIGGPSNPTGQQ